MVSAAAAVADKKRLKIMTFNLEGGYMFGIGMVELIAVAAIFFLLVFALYPFLTLGRIWFYSKRQFWLLQEIKAILENDKP